MLAPGVLRYTCLKTACTTPPKKDCLSQSADLQIDTLRRRVVVAHISITAMVTDMVIAPSVELVAVRDICMEGKPVEELNAASTFWMLKE